VLAKEHGRLHGSSQVQRRVQGRHRCLQNGEEVSHRHEKLQATTMVEIVASYVDHYFTRMLAAVYPGSGLDYDDLRRWHAVWVEAQRNLAEGKDLPELAAQDLDEDLLNGNLDEFLTAEDRRRLTGLNNSHIAEHERLHAQARCKSLEGTLQEASDVVVNPCCLPNNFAPGLSAEEYYQLLGGKG
jgi:hypothetical protein